MALQQLKEAFISLLFPPSCVGCGKEGSFLCGACQSSLTPLPPSHCRLCADPRGKEGLCERCHQSPLLIEGIRSPYGFEGAIREAILHLKYRNLKAIAPVLGQLLYEYLKAHPIPGDVLVPVPLHTRRHRQRGYNQSALIARELGKLMGLTVEEGILNRRIDTPAQTKVAGLEERKNNVKDVFYCKDPSLKERRVLLVDDVCTTGATLEACSMALRGSGALSVWAIAVARET